MKKHILYSLLSLVTLVGAQAQLSNASKLPSDVMMVFSFNFEHIKQKIDIPRLKKLEMVDYLYSSAKRGMGEDSAVVKKMYADPKKYGLNLEPALQLFLRETSYTDENSSLSPALLFHLSSAKKFEKLMKTLFNEGTEYLDFLETKGSFKIYKTYQSAFVWNKKTLYILPITSDNRGFLEKEIDALLALNPTTSLASNQSYLTSGIDKSDIGYWLNYEKFLAYGQHESQTNGTNFFEVDMDRMRGTETNIGLNFLNGALVIEALGKANELLKKESRAVYSKKVNPDFINYLEKDSLIAMLSLAVDIKEFKSSFEHNYGHLLDSLEVMVEKELLEEVSDSNQAIKNILKELDSDTLDWSQKQVLYNRLETVQDSLVTAGMQNMDQKIDSTLQEFQMTREDAWNLFEGDLLLAATGTYTVLDTIIATEYVENQEGDYEYQNIEKTQERPVPLFMGMMTVNLVDKAEFALKKLATEGFLKQKADYYYVSISKYNYYIKLNGNVLILTNDLSLVEKKYQKGQVMVHSMISNELQKNTLENVFYSFVDIENILNRIPDPESQMERYLEPAKATFKHLESKSNFELDQNMNSRTALEFQQKNENSIHILFDLANAYFKLFTGL